MKVLICVPVLNKGGGVASYYRALEKKFSIPVEFVTRGSRRGESNLLSTGVRLLADFIKFCSALKSREFDLVHLNTSLGWDGLIRDSAYILAAKYLYRVKIIIFYRGWNNVIAQRLKGFLLLAFRITFGQTDAAIVLADDFQQQLRIWGYNERIFLETTVVDDHLVDSVDIGRLKRKKRTAMSKFNILFLARIEKAKGIYTALEAYTLLKRKYPFVNLTIAGDGSELAALRKYVERNNLPDVKIVGFVQGREKINCFTKADLYLLPTHREGMPLSVLEALAFGLPVITRPVGGIKDFFKNGRMGFITESLDSQVFAELIEKLIIDPHLSAQISAYNLEYAHDRFLASVIAKRLERIYSEVIDG